MSLIKLPKEADVVIIGSGIMGSAAAYYLSKQNIKVVVLDKSKIANQQSTRAWGFVRQHLRDLDELPLMIESNKLWQNLETELNSDLEWRQNGCLLIGKNDDELDEFKEWIDSARDYNIDTKMLSSREVQSLLPDLIPSNVVGIFTQSDGQAEPKKVTPAFVQRAKDNGALFFEDCGAKKIDLESGKVSGVLTEAGYIKTKQVICAAGADTWRILRMLGLNLPQHFVRGTVFRTSPGPDLTPIATAVNRTGFRQRKDGSFNIAEHIDVDADITLGHLRGFQWYIKPFLKHYKTFSLNLNSQFFKHLKNALPFSEAYRNGSAIHEREHIFDPNMKSVQKTLKQFKENFPSQKDIQIVESWAGGIDVLPDGIPVIDALSNPAGLLVATGFCGHGFALGPIVGKVLSELITSGKSSIDLHSLRFSRYSEGDVKMPSSLF